MDSEQQTKAQLKGHHTEFPRDRTNLKLTREKERLFLSIPDVLGYPCCWPSPGEPVFSGDGFQGTGNDSLPKFPLKSTVKEKLCTSTETIPRSDSRVPVTGCIQS